ncbi:hypothetical protein [Herbaspirillum sp. NPDC101397]|uniref:hypothetical protein n=1 Tax=Herbaspirillum sp. NPDC101397 TaxID=3364006 RepID=UPI00383BB383
MRPLRTLLPFVPIHFNVIPLAPIALPMRRFCFLLLAFLFPLQLFAGTLEPVVNSVAATEDVILIVFEERQRASDHVDADALSSVQAAGDEADSNPDPWEVQADLEDQTLPVPVATLPLDWQSFPHLYPHVSGGKSAFIDILRPPPVV